MVSITAASLEGQSPVSEHQMCLEEPSKQLVVPFVFVNACVVFDIIFVIRIEVDKSDLF